MVGTTVVLKDQVVIGLRHRSWKGDLPGKKKNDIAPGPKVTPFKRDGERFTTERREGREKEYGVSEDQTVKKKVWSERGWK